MKPVSTKLTEQTLQRKQAECQYRPASEMNLPPPESERREVRDGPALLQIITYWLRAALAALAEQAVDAGETVRLVLPPGEAVTRQR